MVVMTKGVQSNRGVEIHKGVFSAPSFISIGDSYVKPLKQWSRMVGKSFSTNPAKKGNYPAGPNSVYFVTEHPWLSKGEKYGDALPKKIALNQTRDDKRGRIAFLSSDANRRGEFTNHYRCIQYKQQIDTEQNIMKQAKPSTYDVTQALMPDRTRKFMVGKLENDTEEVKAGPDKLYDIGRNANTEFSFAQHRDRFYTGRPVEEMKLLGPNRTHLSSLKVGWGHLEVTKFKEISKNAIKPLIRKTFYRTTGLHGIAGGAEVGGTMAMSAGTL